jgi:hypothetical protein
MSDTVEMTTVQVTILGGPLDGWTGRIRVPLEDEAAGRIRVSGVVFRVHRERGRMFLVHPDAQGLIW